MQTIVFSDSVEISVSDFYIESHGADLANRIICGQDIAISQISVYMAIILELCKNNYDFSNLKIYHNGLTYNIESNLMPERRFEHFWSMASIESKISSNIIRYLTNRELSNNEIEEAVI